MWSHILYIYIFDFSILNSNKNSHITCAYAKPMVSGAPFLTYIHAHMSMLCKLSINNIKTAIYYYDDIDKYLGFD